MLAYVIFIVFHVLIPHTILYSTDLTFYLLVDVWRNPSGEIHSKRKAEGDKGYFQN